MELIRTSIRQLLICIICGLVAAICVVAGIINTMSGSWGWLIADIVLVLLNGYNSYDYYTKYRNNIILADAALTILYNEREK